MNTSKYVFQTFQFRSNLNGNLSLLKYFDITLPRQKSSESRVQVQPEGGVGYFSNERGFSVESSLQRISSIFFLQTKRFVGSFLTQRTCGQRSSRVAESKTQGARKLFLPSEFGICSQCQNVDEAEI